MQEELTHGNLSNVTVYFGLQILSKEVKRWLDRGLLKQNVRLQTEGSPSYGLPLASDTEI